MLLPIQIMFEKIVDDIKRGEAGQAMVEYALILSLVSILGVLFLTYLGNKVTSVISHVASSFK